MTVEEALLSALEYERKVRDHYRMAADKADEERAVTFFRLMAGEEDRHVAYLEHLLERWQRGEDLGEPKIPSAVPKAAWVKEGIRKLGKVVPKAQTPASGTEHLETALRLEERVSEHYDTLVQQVDDPRARSVFRRFLEIESGHTALVRAELDYVQWTGHGVGIREFTLE